MLQADLSFCTHELQNWFPGFLSSVSFASSGFFLVKFGLNCQLLTQNYFSSGIWCVGVKFSFVSFCNGVEFSLFLVCVLELNSLFLVCLLLLNTFFLVFVLESNYLLLVCVLHRALAPLNSCSGKSWCPSISNIITATVGFCHRHWGCMEVV